SGRLCQLGT
ncbi:putative ATP-binding component of a transport system, partial [Escherichia coli N1]